ncbi:pheromone-binding protein-like [Battus philenor]|uniref:pheromone-binding protein-like n=1 Tax=Battus philenor TaxID=42288 RepID=UPI0035D09142
MKNMSVNFVKALNVCKKEENLPDSINSDFINFWKEDHLLTNRLSGCAIICLAKKLDLIDSSENFHHGNAEEYAKTHGADEATAKQLVGLLHRCESEQDDGTDPCEATVQVVNCYKAHIHELGWAPDVSLLIAELLTEV